MGKLIFTVTLGVLMLSWFTVLSAGPMIFHNQTDFLNTAGSLSFEGFESLVANNSNSLSLITAAGFVVNSTTSEMGIYNTMISGSVATEGSKFLHHQSGWNETTTFTFNSAINSFGFDIMDYGDFGSGQLTLTNNAGDNVVVAISGNSDGNVQYFGLISESMFTQAVFTNTITGESFNFDKISYGIAVPEPATLLLLGLGGMGMLKKRNSR